MIEYGMIFKRPLVRSHSGRESFVIWSSITCGVKWEELIVTPRYFVLPRSTQ
jgi:hypothetical protein